MSKPTALDKIIDLAAQYEWMTAENVDVPEQARAELAALNATVAEQARQLEQARDVIEQAHKIILHLLSCEQFENCVMRNKYAKEWLAANASAPQVEQDAAPDAAERRSGRAEEKRE